MFEFDEYGYLKPYRPVPTDLSTLEQVFVTEFTSSITRRTLFEHYSEYRTQLLTLLTGGFVQWIDGSFVSRKRDPDDIDVVTFVEADLYSQQERQIDELKQRYRSHRPVVVDNYFVRVYPEGHRLYFDYLSNRVEWLYDWTRTVGRKPKPKGFLEIHF